MGLLNQVYLRNDFDELSRLIESFLHADNDGIITFVLMTNLLCIFDI